MPWPFGGKEEPQQPKKKAVSGEEAVKNAYATFDRNMEASLPGANEAGSIADLVDASTEEKDAYIQHLLDLYQTKTGVSFVGKALGKADVNPPDPDTHYLIKQAISYLGRVKQFLTADDRAEKAHFETMAALHRQPSPEQQEATEAIDRIYGHMKPNLTMNRPFPEQVQTYIDGITLKNAPGALYAGLGVRDERALRQRLKTELLYRLKREMFNEAF